MGLSVGEKIHMVVLLVALMPVQTVVCLLRAVILTRLRSLPLQGFLQSAVLRAVLGTLTPRHIQCLSPSTETTYRTWIRKMNKRCEFNIAGGSERLQTDMEPLDQGRSALLWVGDRFKAKRVVLLFHGGGYVAPLLPGHMEWAWRVYIAAGIEAGVETAVAVLGYTLSPGASYPVQLNQAALGLSRLLSAGLLPRQIIIGGDSAGGNLTAQLLSHILEPHAGVEPITLSEPLCGAFLVSPWLSVRTDFLSFAENHAVDMLSAGHIRASTEALLGDAHVGKARELNSAQRAAFPFDYNPNFIRSMPSATRKLYVTAGQHEVLRGQAEAFVARLGQHCSDEDVRLDIKPGKAHDFIMLEGQREDTGDCMTAMKEWTKELLVE